MISCYFIGHRDTPEDVLPLLKETVEQAILRDMVTGFTVGHYGSFDRMAAAAVLEAKQRHPHLRLYLLLPYHPSDRQTAVPKGFDGTFYPPGMESVPRKMCISRANRYMLDRSDFPISFVHYPASNAWTLVEYAKRRERNGGIKVINLAEDEAHMLSFPGTI